MKTLRPRRGLGLSQLDGPLATLLLLRSLGATCKVLFTPLQCGLRAILLGDPLVCTPHYKAWVPGTQVRGLMSTVVIMQIQTAKVMQRGFNLPACFQS